MEDKTSENIVGKGENAGNQHFLLFPQCFQPFSVCKLQCLIHIYFVICKWFMLTLCQLQNDKVMDWTKAFADNKLNVAEMMISVSDRVENIVELGDNPDYQNCLHFGKRFQKVFF